MPFLRIAWLGLALACAGAGAAQTPASVGGHYLDAEQQRVALDHAAAVWLDGAETGAPPSIRVALTDRPVSPELLERLREPEILFLGDRGELRGLVLRFEAENPEYVYVDVLAARAAGGWRPADQAVIASETLRIERADRARVAASFEADTWIAAAARFDVPVSHDPVAQRLEGEAARASALVALAERRLEARLGGDLAALARVSTRRSAQRYAAAIEGGGEPFAAAMRAHASALRAIVRNPRVAVIRGRTAALGYDNHVEEFALEDGIWKAD